MKNIIKPKETLFDSHCHLDHPKFEGEDVGKLIKSAEIAGVSHILTLGVNLASSQKALEIARKHSNVFAGVGISPHDAGKAKPEDVESISELAEEKQVVAIGEIGLDYYYEFSEKETQKEFFKKQIDVAQDLELPIVIHMRDAAGDVFQIFEEFGMPAKKGVFHCFTGSLDEACKAVELGFYISFSGIITFDKSMILPGIIREIPTDKWLIETDAPYLAPIPKRGKRNEPAFLEHTAKFIGDFLEFSPDDIARITRKNACALFGLPSPEEPKIVFFLGNKIYINLTNRDTNDRQFLTSETTENFFGHNVKIEKEPSADEVWKIIREIDLESVQEVVLGGIGEPTLRLDVTQELARRLKMNFPRLKISLITNGQGSLIKGDNILSDLKESVDSISVLLYTGDPQQYEELCRPLGGEAVFPAILEFIRGGVANGFEMEIIGINLPQIDLFKIKHLSDLFGTGYNVKRAVLRK